MSMKLSRRDVLIGGLVAVVASGAIWWGQYNRFHYLSGDTAAFVAAFSAPPAAGSPQTRIELDELLRLQLTRTPAEVAAAQADKKKDVARFYAALGFDPAHVPDLPKLQRFTDNAEADIGPYVRDVKEKFRRLRPYEIEPKLQPCIGDVKGDVSYPSGHATYGYLMGDLLSELVPERRIVLMKRAAEFAHQRMVCGVHFGSDLDAGMHGAQLLFDEMHRSPDYRRDAIAASDELRTALGLLPRPPRPY